MLVYLSQKYNNDLPNKRKIKSINKIKILNSWKCEDTLYVYILLHIHKHIVYDIYTYIFNFFHI